MCAMGGNLRNRRGKQCRINLPVATVPRGAIWPSHRHGDAKIRATGFELCNLVLEDEIAGSQESEAEVNDGRTARFGQITGGAHHRGDADPAADQNDALGVLACEIEGVVRRFDLDLVSCPARWNSRFAADLGAPRTGSRAMRTTKLTSVLVQGK